MNDRAPIFFFDKLAALADFTTFDVRATENGGMPVSWAVVGTLPNGEIWPVLTDLLTEAHAQMVMSLCELAAIRPDLACWDSMAALSKVDPRRASLMWENRCVVLGKMQKTTDGVKSTAARLLMLANVRLPADMDELEKRLQADFQGRLVA